MSRLAHTRASAGFVFECALGFASSSRFMWAHAGIFEKMKVDESVWQERTRMHHISTASNAIVGAEHAS